MQIRLKLSTRSLDGEFTSCKEKKRIYVRLMSLGSDGEQIARMMFG